MDRTLFAPLTVWPLMLLAAWLAGEWAFRRWRLPRVGAYGVVGLLLGGSGVAQDLATRPALALELLGDVALGLSLFELGYRIHLPWLRRNPWVPVAALLQAGLVFGGIWALGGLFGLGPEPRGVLAALCVATSPTVVVRVTNEWRSAGQATERLVHFCAIGCLLSALLLNGVVGRWHLASTGDWFQAASASVRVFGASLLLGAAFGLVGPWLNRVATSSQATTVTFGLLVLLLCALARAAGLSSLLAALAFGVVARQRRTLLSHAERGFGALGDGFTVYLFVCVGSLLSWRSLSTGLALGVAALALRSAVQVAVGALLARPAGTTVRKGALAGLALAPMTTYALMLLIDSRARGFGPAAQSLPMLTGLLVLLEVAGPLLTQRALRGAGEIDPGLR